MVKQLLAVREVLAQVALVPLEALELLVKAMLAALDMEARYIVLAAVGVLVQSVGMAMRQKAVTVERV